MTKLKLDIPLINGCGTGSYPDVFDRLNQMKACFGAYVIKSVGPFSREASVREKYGWDKEKLGKPNPTVLSTGDVEMNSMALPTHPIESWIEELREHRGIFPIIGSVWGKKPKDYLILAKMIEDYCVAIQLNNSCPNKEEGEQSLMESMTSQAEAIVAPLKDALSIPVWATLSPNEDYASMASVLKEYVDGIICGNTVGPGLVIDIYSGRPVLAGVYGGMSGPAMKPKAMKMVNDVYNIVKDSDVQVIASGGISKWEDVIEYTIAGASIFEIGTSAFIDLEDGIAVGRKSEGIAEFTRDIWEGVQDHLEKEGVTLDELVGSLKK